MFFNHLKTICIAVGVLVCASGAQQLAAARAVAAARPAGETYRLSAVAAQPSHATGAALRSISVGF